MANYDFFQFLMFEKKRKTDVINYGFRLFDMKNKTRQKKNWQSWNDARNRVKKCGPSSPIPTCWHLLDNFQIIRPIWHEKTSIVFSKVLPHRLSDTSFWSTLRQFCESLFISSSCTICVLHKNKVRKLIFALFYNSTMTRHFFIKCICQRFGFQFIWMKD